MHSVGVVGTETFNPNRLILSIEGSTGVYREEIAGAIGALDVLSPHDAENLVATAGEDETAYGPRDRTRFLDTLCSRIDEFLRDDDGGYHKMRVHLTSYDRSAAALEIWFHVGTPGANAGGAWFRHMVVGLDELTVYCDMGPHAEPTKGAAL